MGFAKLFSYAIMHLKEESLEVNSISLPLGMSKPSHTWITFSGTVSFPLLLAVIKCKNNPCKFSFTHLFIQPTVSPSNIQVLSWLPGKQDPFLLRDHPINYRIISLLTENPLSSSIWNARSRRYYSSYQ